MNATLHVRHSRVPSRRVAATRCSRNARAAGVGRSRNPVVGRALAGHVADAGLTVETVDAVAVAVRDASVASTLFLLEDAVDRVGTHAARRWLHDLGELSARGAFCAALTLFLVVGRS